MKKSILTIVMATLCLFYNAKAQQQQIILNGKITDRKGIPIPGSTIKIKDEKVTALTNTKGEFNIVSTNQTGTLQISYLGYKFIEIPFNPGKTGPFIVTLTEGQSELKEVEILSTGYQTLSREKTTGSFVQLDNKLLNRSTSTNILDRIKDVAEGVYFENRDPEQSTIPRTPNNKSLGITVRGQSTFSASKQPLIILDNFPYEGEIKNINPNDIENITILKDASAASIWGARSANGVIVITTKKGKLNQKMSINLSSNATIIHKPDLFYSRNFLDSKSYIEVEKYLYDKSYFNAQLNDLTSFPTVSPVVELMKRYDQASSEVQRAAIESQLDALKLHDVRNDFSKYVYQKAINQQYALSLRGGTSNMTYSLSVGRDDNRNNLVRNGYQRTSINSLNTYKPLKNLEITAGINYSQNTTSQNNKFAFGYYNLTGTPYSSIFPYAELADETGNAMPLLQARRASYLESTKEKGFLDWNYRPLDEINLGDDQTNITDLLLRFSAKYQLIPQLSLQVNYQNERQLITERNHQRVDTYYARNLINRFSTVNPATGVFTYNFPKGGILDLYNGNWRQNNLRGQLNYEQSFGKHELSALSGIEFLELKNEGFSRTSYGYNDQFGTSTANLNYGTSYPTNPSGSAFIPAPSGIISGNLNRNISYYAIGGYSYDHKYTLNLSARKDGANLFGADANDKFTPLWSAGLGWNLSKEPFYKLNWLSELRIRATYGYQGNTSLNGSAYLTGSYNVDSSTGASYISVITAPNPQLQWESIRNINLAMDFSIKNDILKGTIEFYQKNGKNLIQPSPLAPQTGFTTYQANTASTLTKGIDISLQSQNLSGKFKWSTSILFSAIKDKIVKYDVPRTASSILSPGFAVGKPLNALFSYKWAGLNPVNGNPRGYLKGQISEDYAAIRNNFNPDSLVYNGSRIPTVYGALRNDLSYKGFNLSVNISYRLGYVFRRTSTSLNYTDIINKDQHSDYNLRWQKPGDENMTSIPSLVYPANSNRNTFYRISEATVASGDHIRLQDIRFGYEFPLIKLKSLNISNLNLFTYANNIGIIWRRNKLGIDPSEVSSGSITYPLPFSISFGITANF
ncbi:SusC/RagA family TonB-linked outer membrane protein [Pedobacter hiemivivus]|uniref:SusC/RagA family TonB-linked outer membrane protein n=1 Tax=Pedobacter hiemivivus TaxID=2530454 RepID=A0A4R0NDK4_9SPHI|nr:SusC/RagA family TonB-linked outer membrane protein [Pedobacter hiemivivus]TCC98471.1 SusC/RagA family TonB-linked outer membrane protein [Pedobacter hiemivivus]